MERDPVKLTEHLETVHYRIFAPRDYALSELVQMHRDEHILTPIENEDKADGVNGHDGE